jgi:hypothetical protein
VIANEVPDREGNQAGTPGTEEVVVHLRASRQWVGLFLFAGVAGFFVWLITYPNADNGAGAILAVLAAAAVALFVWIAVDLIRSRRSGAPGLVIDRLAAALP